MEVMVFDVPMLATKMIWLMMESITPPWQWMLMKTCLVVFCIFNNSVNIKPSHPLLQTEWSAVICSRAGWYQLTEAITFEMWWVCFFSPPIFYLFIYLFELFSSCVFVVMSEHKVKMEFILWYHLPVQTKEMLTQGDITLVSVLSMPLHLSFPVS